MAAEVTTAQRRRPQDLRSLVARGLIEDLVPFEVLLNLLAVKDKRLVSRGTLIGHEYV